MTCPRCRRDDCPSTIDHRHAGRCNPAPPDETPLYAFVAKALRVAGFARLALLPVGVVLTIAEILHRRKTKPT